LETIQEHNNKCGVASFPEKQFFCVFGDSQKKTTGTAPLENAVEIFKSNGEKAKKQWGPKQ